MPRLPSYSTLIGIAGTCGIGVSCMMILMHKQTEKFANQANFIQRALVIMREEPKVRELLGDKLEVGRASFGDGWSKLQNTSVQVRVPIKGELDNAYLYAYARRRDVKDKMRLFKVEASFEKIANKKLVILDRTNEEDLEDEVELEVRPEQVGPASKQSKEEAESKEKQLKEPQKLTKEEYKQQMKSWVPR